MKTDYEKTIKRLEQVPSRLRLLPPYFLALAPHHEPTISNTTIIDRFALPISTSKRFSDRRHHPPWRLVLAPSHLPPALAGNNRVTMAAKTREEEEEEGKEEKCPLQSPPWPNVPSKTSAVSPADKDLALPRPSLPSLLLLHHPRHRPQARGKRLSGMGHRRGRCRSISGIALPSRHQRGGRTEEGKQGRESGGKVAREKRQDRLGRPFLPPA